MDFPVVNVDKNGVGGGSMSEMTISPTPLSTKNEKAKINFPLDNFENHTERKIYKFGSESVERFGFPIEKEKKQKPTGEKGKICLR